MTSHVSFKSQKDVCVYEKIAWEENNLRLLLKKKSYQFIDAKEAINKVLQCWLLYAGREYICTRDLTLYPVSQWRNVCWWNCVLGQSVKKKKKRFIQSIVLLVFYFRIFLPIDSELCRCYLLLQEEELILKWLLWWANCN